MSFQALAQESTTIIWQPQPGPQTALLECPVFEVFYGGARGGGKTESSLGDWMQHANLYGEAAGGVFFRRQFKQLSEVIARSKQLFKKLGATYNEQKSEWTMPNGARLLFRYLERDVDAEAYQGHNYTRIYVEELTNFPSPKPINLLRACLRSATGVPCGMRLTGNPGGPGHNWVKERYITPNPKGYQIITESMEIEVDGVKQSISLSRVFIPSKLGDNALLMRNDPTYVMRLTQSGSAALVKAWLDGNWDIVDGAFFDNWGDQNVLDTSVWLPRIPQRALRFRSFDWGSARPFSVGWWVVSDGKWGLPPGALVRYKEWYGASAPNVGLKMTVDNVARGIVEREKADGLVIHHGVADPAIFITDGGPSKAETMAVHGASFLRADNKRKSGADQVRQRIYGHVQARDDKGIPTVWTPMLYVLDNCSDTIRTLPTLQHDDTDTEDIDTEGEDHAYDEIRYACMSRPWIPREPGAQVSDLPKLPGEYTFNDLLKIRTDKRLAEERRL